MQIFHGVVNVFLGARVISAYNVIGMGMFVDDGLLLP